MTARGQTDVRQAIDTARALAAQSGEAHTVWRCGERLGVAPERARSSDAIPDPDGPIRPVATYDPDGTEHS